MKIHHSTLGRLAFSTILLTIPFNSAFAQDASAISDRLKAAIAKQGINITWSGVTGDASSMVLEGVAVAPVGETEKLEIGKVTLEGITEDGGNYSVETVTTAPFSKTEDGVAVDASEFVISGMTIPAENETDALASMMMYEGADLAHLTVKVGDKTAFAMENLGFEMTPPADGNPLEFTGAAEKFSADLTLIEDARSKAAIEALGYQNITGYFELAGSWQPKDGRIALSQYDISVENAGTYGMSFDFGGYTLDFIKSLQEMQKKMAEQPEGADNSATGMAMLGLMQQLTLHAASIRFDDDSLTKKVLDYLGKQQGMSGSDIANQAKAIVPFLTAQLNNPDLSAQITSAVNAFLDNPQNIEVAAAPTSPVPFALIMAGAMSNPLDLTKTLGVKVTANQ